MKDIQSKINKILDKTLSKKVKVNKLTPTKHFDPSAHHPVNPGVIDDETWWYPNKSGPIKKGYYEGDYYDATRKVVLDKKGGRVVHDRKKYAKRFKR